MDTLEATIHGYPATYTKKDGWRCNEAHVERFLRRNCTPGLDPDPDQCNVDARKDLEMPADVLEHAALLAAIEYFGAFTTRRIVRAPVVEASPEPPHAA